MKKPLITVVAFFITACLAFFSLAFAQTIVVVPNSRENINLGGTTIIPFNCGLSSTSMRYQQVYLGPQFPQAGLLDKISFRLDSSIGPMSGFGPTALTNVLIEMSTTQAQPGSLSNTFADNIGPDVQTVFSGNLSLSAPDCNETAPQPCPFDVMILLQSPFYYNPQDGNLLLDVRIPVCVDTTGRLNVDFLPSIARAFSDDVDSPVAAVDFERGLVTQFRITEPPPQFITLSPSSATNDAGTEHTVIATVLTNGFPDPGELVTFDVVSGPNAGETSDPGSGECTPNDDCTTDANGQVSWTYTGNGVPGTDTIIASFTDVTNEVIESDPAEKMWVGPIPTLSEWGLIAMAGILGIAGFMVIRRRKVSI